MSQASLAIILHFHQPEGNSKEIFKKVTCNCYKPTVNYIFNYPHLKIGIHVSGCLLEYFEKESPDILGKIRQMVKRKQIEIIGGGFYEPVFASIPPRDISGQIEMMNSYIKENFGCSPRGTWIPERVWQPFMAHVLSSSGMDYCILDDTHFKKAGIKQDQTYGYYMTEYKNGKIAVFGSNKALRYSIPFKDVFQVRDYIKTESSNRQNPLFVYADDVEKFGEWPGTYKLVFEKQWLKRFFDELTCNSSWLKTVHLSDYLDSNETLGEISIPEASYDEMIEWTGGCWENFLKKYPETKQMHKKMWHVSTMLEDNKDVLEKTNSFNEAKKYLYKGQCNCGYWHGEFGGLYLYHLRRAVYNNLILADTVINKAVNGKGDYSSIKNIKFHDETDDEWLMETEMFSLYFNAHEGGVLKELDCKFVPINLINTFSRKKEAYHENILIVGKSCQGGCENTSTIHQRHKDIFFSLEEGFIYDKYPRYCFRDHFIDKDTNIEKFQNNTYQEHAFFDTGEYKTDIKSKNILIMEKESEINGKKAVLSKEFRTGFGNSIKAVYNIRNNSDVKIDSFLAVEFNLTLPELNSYRYGYRYSGVSEKGLNDKGETENCIQFSISDFKKDSNTCNVNFDFSKAAQKVWFFPVKTVSQSEKAYELNFQCSCLLFGWDLNLEAYEEFSVGIYLSINQT